MRIKGRRERRRQKAINNLIGYYVLLPLAVLTPMFLLFAIAIF